MESRNAAARSIKSRGLGIDFRPDADKDDSDSDEDEGGFTMHSMSGNQGFRESIGKRGAVGGG